MNSAKDTAGADTAFTVKPLVWTDKEPPPGFSDDEDDGSQWAEGVGGWYHWKPQPDAYVGILWRVDDPFTFVEPLTFEQAQELAQTDHEIRVRALIEAKP